MVLKQKKQHLNWFLQKMWKLLHCRLKVRQIRNIFFKMTFLPKKEWTNLTLLLATSFRSFFGWKWRHQKIISKLTGLEAVSSCTEPKKRKVATDIVNSTNNVLGHDLACKSKEVVLPIHFSHGIRTPNETFFQISQIFWAIGQISQISCEVFLGIFAGKTKSRLAHRIVFCLLFCFSQQTKQICSLVLWENLWLAKPAFGFIRPLVLSV